MKIVSDLKEVPKSVKLPRAVDKGSESLLGCQKGSKVVVGRGERPGSYSEEGDSCFQIGSSAPVMQGCAMES